MKIVNFFSRNIYLTLGENWYYISGHGENHWALCCMHRFGWTERQRKKNTEWTSATCLAYGQRKSLSLDGQLTSMGQSAGSRVTESDFLFQKDHTQIKTRKNVLTSVDRVKIIQIPREKLSSSRMTVSRRVTLKSQVESCSLAHCPSPRNQLWHQPACSLKLIAISRKR